jgi:hypothetical protein
MEKYINELKNTVYKQERIREAGLWDKLGKAAGKALDTYLAGIDAQAKQKDEEGNVKWQVYIGNTQKVLDAYRRKYSARCKKEHGFMAGKDWQSKSGMFAEKMRHCMAVADVKAIRSTLSWIKQKKTKCGKDVSCLKSFLVQQRRLEQLLQQAKAKKDQLEKTQFFHSRKKRK